MSVSDLEVSVERHREKQSLVLRGQRENLPRVCQIAASNKLVESSGCYFLLISCSNVLMPAHHQVHLIQEEKGLYGKILIATMNFKMVLEK